MSKFDEYRKRLTEGSPPEEPSKVETQNAQDYKDQRDLTLPSPTDDGGNFLKSFLKATPFFDLFEYVADRSYVGKFQTRVAKLKASQPTFYRACTCGDVTVRVVVVIIVLYVSFRAALKILK